MVFQKQGGANVGSLIVGTRGEKRREQAEGNWKGKKSQIFPVSRTELAIKLVDLAT